MGVAKTISRRDEELTSTPFRTTRARAGPHCSCPSSHSVAQDDDCPSSASASSAVVGHFLDQWCVTYRCEELRGRAILHLHLHWPTTAVLQSGTGHGLLE